MICNACGKDCSVAISTDDPPLTNTVGESFSYIGCYGSYALHDMVKYEWSLCEQCLAKLFSTFVIPPNERELRMCDLQTREEIEEVRQFVERYLGTSAPEQNTSCPAVGADDSELARALNLGLQKLVHGAK